MLYLKPKSGHTIHASHIEKPELEFYVKWLDAQPRETAELGVVWEAGERWAKVLAETPAGALRIARYHHFMGSRHQLTSNPEVASN